MGTLIPVVFSEFLCHDVFKKYNPISAGFCSIINNKVKIWGNSTSLKLSPNEKDQKLLEQLFFLPDNYFL